MIKNTYADCKIINQRVTGSTAYVTLLIYSTKPAEEHRKFQFYITDDRTNLITDIHTIELTSLSNNIYWIDRTNNYENATVNIDVNMYKEIVLEIDISKQNQGEIRDNRWVRECNIVMLDMTNNANSIAWISTTLSLISAPIILPEIKNLSFMSYNEYEKDEEGNKKIKQPYRLQVDFDYTYESQEDFNYQNKNIYIKLSTISNKTLLTQESVIIRETHINDNRVAAIFDKTYDDYVRIRIEIFNNKDVCMYMIEKLYKPVLRTENTYIKLNGIIHKVNYIYYKDENDSIRNTIIAAREE